MPKKKPTKRSARADVDSRIEVIAGMMLRAEWIPGDSHKTLAATWRVGVPAVEKYASTASRIALERLGGKEQVRAWGLSVIQRCVMAAAAEGDLKTAIDGADRFLKLTGADAPQKVALTNTKGEDLPEYMHRNWPPAVWAWVGDQAKKGHAPSEAEMAAYAETLPLEGSPVA